AFLAACGQDETLRPALDRWRGMRVSAGESLYEYLVIATVLQNATVRRTVQMFANLFAAYGSQVTFDGKALSAFWSAQEMAPVPEEDLRALKLGYRAKTLLRQAQAFVAGTLNEAELRACSNERLKKSLLALYGIGPASVWYLMFELFKRYDALDYLSPWEQKIYSRLLFDAPLVDAPTILREVNQRWGPWRMLAMHYLFEDLFWQRKHQPVAWLEELIRL
ncbi:MAG TPA: hypothetical protein VFF78_08780, partial [Anaerolineaceae bacterium]|nr:hypothetical protein [Anaerolineaceae bacterium]